MVMSTRINQYFICEILAVPVSCMRFAEHGHRLNPLGPGQKGNVWRPNSIKHCLVTKHVTFGTYVQKCRLMRFNALYD